ncbi:MAG: arsenic transporter [Candidatus Eremiobacteraeota bacterium]|nr:arsenic transporter [Candidatus Eremiobacteraeota bacterium]
MLTRARGIAEWMWAAAGAVALVATRAIAPRDAWRAVASGTDVYLFLAGMMVLAELARHEGVFDWLAAHAARASGRSRFRLFALVYAAATLVTVLLSNDATAVVLTPAVAAVVRRAKADPLPHLYACAFVANAASFVLPISNPANLVIYGGAMPRLGPWLAAFSLPSLLAIAATFVGLASFNRKSFRGESTREDRVATLTGTGKITVVAVGVTALALIVASAGGAHLGVVTSCASALAFLAVCVGRRGRAPAVLQHVSWSVLGLVAALFIIVRALDSTGSLDVARHGVEGAATWGRVPGTFALGFATAAIANITNNLPAGVVAGAAVSALRNHDALRRAATVGIDLGPNFSVTGSLATVLWMTILRREGLTISAGAFLRIGAAITPLALGLALAGICATSRS